MTVIGVLFLVGPLLVVPLGIRLVGDVGPRPPISALAILGSAAVLIVALVLPAGPTATAAAIPWLVVTIAHAASMALGPRAPDRFRRHSAWIDVAAAGFLVVGAGWIVADRLGLRPLGFDPTIVRLTAVHFHFAGFGLLTIIGRLAARDTKAIAPVASAAAVTIGVPLVAGGFLGVPLAGSIGVTLVALGGLAVGLLQLGAAPGMPAPAARWLARIGGASLFITMPMAILWQAGQVLPITGIDFTTMIRVHGTLNALGFAVPSMIAWTLDRSSVQLARPITLGAR